MKRIENLAVFDDIWVNKTSEGVMHRGTALAFNQDGSLTVGADQSETGDLTQLRGDVLSVFA